MTDLPLPDLPPLPFIPSSNEDRVRMVRWATDYARQAVMLERERRMEDVKLPEPTFWVAAPPRGGLALTEVQPSAWGAYPVYTAEQVRAAVLAERERCAKVCEERHHSFMEGAKRSRDEGEFGEGQWAEWNGQGAKACAAAIRKG